MFDLMILFSSYRRMLFSGSFNFRSSIVHVARNSVFRSGILQTSRLEQYRQTLCCLPSLTTAKGEQERRGATEDKIRDLPHVDSLPFIVWIALVASGAERFTFYDVTKPRREFNNLLPQKHADVLIFLPP
jgi:hypothetical protein